MRVLIIIEWQRMISRRSTLALVLLSVLVTALTSAAYAAIANAIVTDGKAFDAQELVSSVVSKGSVAPLFAGVIAAVIITGDLKHGIFARSVLITPDRRAVLVAKFIAVMLVAAIMAAACWLTSAAVSLLIVGDSAVGGLGILAVVEGVAAHLFFTVAWSVVAASMAMLVRSQTPATVLTFAFPLVIEPTLRGVGAVMGSAPLAWVAAVMPWSAGASMQQYVASGTDLVHLVSADAISLSRLAAVAVLAAVALISAAASLRTFSQRSLV